MFFCNMYTDTNTQKEVQKATGEHTTDNGNSEEWLDGNRVKISLCDMTYSPTPVLGEHVGTHGWQHPYEQGQIPTLSEQK